MYDLGFFIKLIVFSLACFRLTNMFYEEAMPFYIGLRIRHLAGIRYPNFQDGHLTLKEVIYNYQNKMLSDTQRISMNGFAELFNCFWCLSVWSAFVLVSLAYLFPEFGFYFVIILCVSSLAIIIKEKF